MTNPWLSVSLTDYEGHMGSAEVQQLAALSELFAAALALRRPDSVAILGIAGGNGLEHINAAVTQRVAGFDINPSYLETVLQRFPHLPRLELHCADLERELAQQVPGVASVQLVHAALVFEHAGVGQCLENALSLVGPGGALSVVLQLPSPSEGAVSASPFASMQNLKSHFSLVDRQWLCETLEGRNLRLALEAGRALPRGKAFWMGVFVRE